ncbi:MAG: hypothetical protein U1F36_03515 [Planctomycetota bacterium]
MTVFGSGYRALDYQPTSMLRRLWALAVLDVRAPFRTKFGTILFLLCQLPGYAALVLLLIWSGFWQLGNARNQAMHATGAMSPTEVDFYLSCATSQQAFLTITTLVTFTVARAIAKDRASQAIEILWTRGITPIGYFAGRVLGAVCLLGLGIVVMPALLWVFAWINAVDGTFLSSTIAFLPRLFAALLFHTVAVAFLATAISCLPRTANVASILWAMLLVGGRSLGTMVTHFASDPVYRALGPWDDIRRVTEAIAGVQPAVEFPLGDAVVGCIVLAVAAVVVVFRRLRMVEAIG